MDNLSVKRLKVRLEMNVQMQQKLQDFIENLLEKKMSEHEIQAQMEELGMKYSEDPLTRLNLLLQKLHPQDQIKETLHEPKI